MKEIVEVAVDLPVSKTFHYRIPEKMKDSLQVGMRVLLPFKGRKVTGLAFDINGRLFGFKEELSDTSDSKTVIGCLGCSGDLDCVLMDDIFNIALHSPPY